jgi:hypothetical protein
LTRYGYVGHSGIYLYYRCNFDEIQGVIETVTALSAEKKKGSRIAADSLKNGKKERQSIETMELPQKI